MFRQNTEFTYFLYSLTEKYVLIRSNRQNQTITMKILIFIDES